MNFKSSMCIIAMAFIASAIPVRLAAQDDHQHKREHHKYKLVDVGTFGGPESLVNDGNPPISQVLNERGTVVGIAATSTPDPYSPNCLLDCVVDHAFEWRDGVLMGPGFTARIKQQLGDRDQSPWPDHRYLRKRGY